MSCLRLRQWLTGLAFLAAAGAHGCGGGGQSATSPTSVTISALTISGNSTFTAVGQTAQFNAAATMSDGSSRDVTSLATWQSSSPAIATASATGLITATATGAASITSSYQGKSASRPVTVTIPSVPNLLGTWRGVSGIDPYYWYKDGPMYWVITAQQGLTFSGNFRVENDLIVNWGVGRGQISGTIVQETDHYILRFTAQLPKGQLPIWPDCSFELSGQSERIGVPISAGSQIIGSMDEWLCGQHTNRPSNGFVIVRQ